MSVGTKSVLFGAHAFWLHPFFVAWAWTKLYGFPWDPRLWVAFFVHDLGYWGSPNMDGPEGEEHPRWGARLMSALFDGPQIGLNGWTYRADDGTCLGSWGRFTLYHSRFFAKKHGERPSRLCIADKLALTLTPSWLYVPMAVATGEIREYTKLASEVRPDTKGEDERLQEIERGLPSEGIPWRAYLQWHRELRAYLRRWVEEHRDGREDTWTPDTREARDETGVWR